MRGRTIFKICAASYIAVVILIAVILGIVSTTGVTLSCRTVQVNEEMYAYWQAQQRYRYLVNHASGGARDTATFWSQSANDGTDRTHDEVVNELTRDYAEYVAAAAYLYDSQGYVLSDSAVTTIEKSFEDRTASAFAGSKETFAQVAEKYGFTLSAAVNAECMVKKMQLLREYLTADSMQQDAYYAEKYVRVKMIYVETGDPAYEDKCAMLRLALEKEESQEMQDAGEDDFSRAVADPYFNEDDTSREKHPDGWYFSPSSQFTNDNNETAPLLVETILNMEIYESHEVSVVVDNKTRTYFIRRYELASLAYGVEDNSVFFGDFVSLATDYYFFEWCDTAREEIVWKERNIRAWVPVGSGENELYKFFY